MTTLFNPEGSLVVLRLFRKRLKEGADPNELWQSWKPNTLDSQQPILLAARHSVAHLDLLLDHPDINLHVAYQTGRDALATAVYFGNAKAIPRLIEAGANVNSVDQYGATPLHHATGSKGDEAIALLLAHGANPNVVGPYGRTPIHELLMEYTLHTAPLEAKLAHLLAAGANPNAQDDNGRTPLHSAATSGYVRITQELLAAGANADLRDYQGQRPDGVLEDMLANPQHPDRQASMVATLDVLLTHRRARLAQYAVVRETTEPSQVRSCVRM